MLSHGRVVQEYNVFMDIHGSYILRMYIHIHSKQCIHGRHTITIITVELLQELLSKSKGFILRLAAVMHVAFHLETPDDIPLEISPEVLKATKDFIDMCCQHAAYMAE